MRRTVTGQPSAGRRPRQYHADTATSRRQTSETNISRKRRHYGAPTAQPPATANPPRQQEATPCLAENEMDVYDTIRNAELRTSRQMAQELEAKAAEAQEEYLIHEGRVSDLLYGGAQPANPDVLTAAEQAAQAKVRMRGIKAELEFVYGALMSDDNRAAA